MSLVDRLVSGDLSVPQFREAYYDFYVEEVPEDAMSDRDYEFFGGLQEKLDWTSPFPSDDERVWGWIDYEEYVGWVKRERDKYIGASGLD